ncbi:MAG: CAP domain-containing protein [Dehalococcoidia bacterium]
MDSEEQTFLNTLNGYRAQNGLGPLSLDSQLNDVARWMANDMASHNYFSHTDSLGRDPFARMDAMGYSYNTYRGENLVAGTEGAQASLEMWKGSPGHNANMLSPNYTVIGIARAYDATSAFGWYWATEFGGHTAPPPPVAPPPEPEPVAPAPAPVVVEQPTPAPIPPAPVAEQAPPPPAPTATPETVAVNAPVSTEETPWWHSLRLVADVLGQPEPSNGSFIGSLRSVMTFASSRFGDLVSITH